MAIGLNDINKTTDKKRKMTIDLSKLDKQETQKALYTQEPGQEADGRPNLKDLSLELKKELKDFDLTIPKDTKRPWQSFTVAEMSTNLRAKKAVVKAQIIKERNEKMVKELRDRSDMFMRDPESFFNN
jgi:hypothetical protein